MKKNFRKITAMATAILTASCLMMPMNFTASAAGSISIANDASGHTYEAYQIFDGTLANDGSLTNIVWGAGISDGDGLLAALKTLTVSGATPFSGCTSASAVADVLAPINTDDAEITKAFAAEVGKYLNATPQGSDNTAPYSIEGLDDGYYLVKDKDGSMTGAEDDSYTRYIVKVLGTATDINPKDGLPTLEKKVKDADDTAGTTSDFQDSADHDIGDVVEFQLTGTLPENYDDYKTAYNYIIHDTLSNGLTFDKTSVAVTVDGVAFDAANYTVNEPGTDGATFDIVFTNLKNFANITKDSDIVVTYKATLNNNAVTGTAGNPNTASLEYSNNPNDDGTNTGKTPDDKVVVFTYKTIINKVDSGNQPLAGAEFTLQKKLPGDDQWQDIAVTKNTEGTIFTFNGLDDGQYRLKETVTPDGYNSISDIYFKVEAAHDELSDDPQLTSLTGTAIDADGNTVTPATIEFEVTPADGLLEADILNKKGSELPSTGGMGTEVFLIGGGVLVAVAGVLLIAKRRMSSK